ncbi:MAG TPA: chloride channel protein [Vicinamibacterales bacterium]|nr:chloride channel protein [Vicinamibacterales bacterium]
MPTAGEGERPGAGRSQTSQTRVLFILTVVVGALSGLAAVAFHLSIDVVNDHLLAPVLARSLVGRTVGLFVLLPLTGLIVGVLLWRLVPFARGSGIPEVKTAYQFGPGPHLAFRTAAGKFILGALSIGSGFSLGREGPTVQICAAIGAAVAKFTRRPSRMTRTLISVGAAAGIAAAFNTPIAAITFAMEEVIGDLQQRLVGAIVVAAVAAAVVERAVMGGRPIFTVPNYSLGAWWELLVYAALGVVCGLGATVFVKGLLGLRRWVKAWTGAPVWAKPALGGVAMAAIGLLWPQVLGIGYPTMSAALVGSLSTASMAILGGAKLVATVVSYSWGLSGGIFSPALFVGAMLGGATGAIVHQIVPASPDTIGSFALVGMGAFFAGAVRAPITSILIIFEMTGDYAIILPLMISNVLSYTIAARLQPRPIYDALLAQDGVPVADHETHRDLRAIAAEQVMTPVADVIPASTRVRDATVRVSPDAPAHFVVDDAGRLTGIVTGEDLARAAPDAFVRDTARPDVVTIFADESLDAALLRLGRHRLARAPVVSRLAPDQLVGLLTLDAILGAVDRAASEREG